MFPQYLLMMTAMLRKRLLFCFWFFLQFSQENEETNVQEDDLSISELPSEFDCSDGLTMDVAHGYYKEELDLDSCLPR